MRSLFVAVVVLATIASAGLFSPPKKPEITMYDFLKGEWDMVMFRSPLTSGEIPEEQESVHFSFTGRNTTKDVLDGVYATDEGRKYFQVRFMSGFLGEYLVPVAGAVPAKAAKPAANVEDENNKVEEAEEEEKVELGDDQFESLFKFNFQNLTALHFIAQGKYGKDATYQATVSSAQKPSFVFTVRTDKEIITLLATKYMPAPQPTFFQKYGMIIMMSVMMFTQMRAKPPVPQQEREGEEGEGDGNNQGQPAAAPAAAPSTD